MSSGDICCSVYTHTRTHALVNIYMHTSKAKVRQLRLCFDFFFLIICVVMSSAFSIQIKLKLITFFSCDAIFCRQAYILFCFASKTRAMGLYVYLTSKEELSSTIAEHYIPLQLTSIKATEVPSVA